MRVFVLFLIAAILAGQVFETTAYLRQRRRHVGKYRGSTRSYLRWKYGRRHNNYYNDNQDDDDYNDDNDWF
ncbi:hypothetical protein Q1695_002743 [Nippostrongylus brasiliensis]|nr:hypothetical protein Q1695_002743 [Nippostrongylus brasiliensis]